LNKETLNYFNGHVTFYAADVESGLIR